MMKKRVKNGNGGFTLLEVILSIAILGMITVPLMKYFSDSLRFTALTAQQQKATLLAQDTIESLKSYDRLITKTTSVPDPYYWVTPLAGRYPEPAEGDETPEYDVECGEFDVQHGTTGAGAPLVLKKENVERDGLRYDVYVSLATDVDANRVERPVIYGVDDRKSVMIVEHDQEQEAMLRFLAMNTGFVLTQEGEAALPGSTEPSESSGEAEGSGDEGSSDEGSSESGSDEAEDGSEEGETKVAQLTMNDVRRNLGRTIYVQISKVDSTPESDYTVRAYYEYTCTGVTDSAKDTYVTSDLINTRVQELNSIYILFNIVDPENDKIEISWDTSMGISPQPEIVLVCQNLDQLGGGSGDEPSEEPSESIDAGGGDPGDPEDPPYVMAADLYELKLQLNNFTWDSDHGSQPTIRTNIIGDSSIGGESKGSLVPADSICFDPESEGCVVPLTKTEDAIRVIEIEVSIYEHGRKFGVDEPLVVMKTTKGE